MQLQLHFGDIKAHFVIFDVNKEIKLLIIT